MLRLASFSARSLLFAVASLGSRALLAQCVAPPGPYSLTVAPAAIPVVACPGSTIAIDVIGNGGVSGIIGYSFNLSIAGPGAIVAVTAPAGSPLGGFFIVSGTQVAGLGAPLGPPAPVLGPVVLATILFAPAVVPAATTMAVDFTGSVSLPTGFPVLNSVTAVNACDVLSPVLATSAGAITASPCAGNFIRGDCNNNGIVGGVLGDVLYLLNYIFLGGAAPACENACDANDSGSLDFTDAVYLLNWNLGLIFAPPPPPSPVVGLGLGACGPDPTPGPLTCTGGICP